MTFRILEHQLRALGDQTQASFIARMERHFREHLAEFVATLRPDELPAWLTRALALAHESDIHTEPEVAQLMLLLTKLGLDLPPWARAALHDRTLLPVGKLSQLIREAERHHPTIRRLVVYPTFQRALADPAATDAAGDEVSP